jgi:hypothetical protein
MRSPTARKIKQYVLEECQKANKPFLGRYYRAMKKKWTQIPWNLRDKVI